MNRSFSPLFYFVAVLLAAMSLASCQPKYVSDYDYRKADEAYLNDDYDEAMRLVEKQLKATPKNVDALYLRALIHYEADEYTPALKDIDRALRYYGGESEVERSRICALKGLVFQSMDRLPDAAKAFSHAEKYARKDDPGHVQDILFMLAHAYYKSGDRSAAEKVYRKMLKDDSEDKAAMVGLARNRLDDEKYEEALEWLEKAQAIDEDYSSVYKFKMRVFDKMDHREACVEAALKYLELDDDAPISGIADYCGKYYDYAVAKVKSLANSSDEPLRWQVLLTALYEDHGDYRSALGIYNQLIDDLDRDAVLLVARAQCFEELEDYRKAADDYAEAFEQTGDWEYLGNRGDALRSGGFYEEAIRNYQACQEKDPSEGYYYYAIGWSYELSGDFHQAILFFDEGIKVDQSYPYLFLSRADLLKQYHPDEARADYEKVLELDTVPGDGSCRHYALLGLGRAKDAEDWMRRVIAADPDDKGSYYDMACLYGRMGRLEESLAALDTAFQKGFRRFAHLEHDDDMDPIRNLPAYKALVEKYKSYKDQPKPNVGTPAPDSSFATHISADSLVSEIPMKRKPGGTYEVPCSINGLPLKFIFDTGASDITLSSVEADFMLKNDYLSERDFRGSRKYLTASGNICEGAVIRLKEVKVGEFSLKNIEASVVKNQKAPLLLGQSALERFGSITIDNENNRIIIRR